MATNDTVEVHIKGFGFTYDGKITPGDSVEVERARKATNFVLDLAAGEPTAPPATTRRPRNAKPELPAVTAMTSTEPETL